MSSLILQPTRQYTPGPGYEQNVMSLLLNRGDIAGRGALMSGQAWGRAAEQIGNLAAGAVQANAERKAEGRRSQAFQAFLQDGSWMQDPKIALAGSIKIFGPAVGPKVARGLWDWKEISDKGDVEDLKRVGNTIGGLEGLTDAEIAPLWQGIRQKALPAVVNNLGVKPEEIPEQWNPEQRNQVFAVGRMLRGEKPPEAPKPMAVGGRLVQPTPEGGAKVLYEPPPEAAKPETRSIDAQLADAALRGDRATYGKLLQVKREAEAAGRAPEAPDVVLDLTPAGVEMAARRYLKDGTLPPMGMGKAGAAARKRILNRAAEIDPEADIAAAAAGYGADKASLTKIQTMRDAIGSFENTASKNIDIFLEQAGQVVDTGSPLANSLARQVSGKMLGSKNQAAYDAARQVAINEVAKITSNPTLAGQLSDTARREVEAFNPANATLAQTVAVMRVLKRDMENRKVSLDAAITEIKGRIGGKGNSGGGASKDSLLKKYGF